ncbi:AAA family ATPase [bacterium]|nr:AAA family ATPase [bacterium]
MKKNDIIELIKAHIYNNDSTFRSITYDIAREFNENGDQELSDYLLSLLSTGYSFVAQSNASQSSTYFTLLSSGKEPLYLPDEIKNDLMGIANAIKRNIGINKFLFEGEPGTGKTESVKQLARILNRQIYSVNFDFVIDSRLGQTSKNIVSLFKEINAFSRPAEIIVLFDEIDALALDRVNGNDLREMGRATSTLLKSFDSLNQNLVLIATTNLFGAFDKALIRRFDAVINFNRYSLEDLCEIADFIVEQQCSKFNSISKNSQLLHKILRLNNTKVMPGDLKNIIKTSIAFSNPASSTDYLRRIYKSVPNKETFSDELKYLYEKRFTYREMEILTGISKSEIARILKEV